MIIFETTDRGAKQVFDHEGKILHFNRQNLNLAKTKDGKLTRMGDSDSWVCVLEDPDLIARAKKHKGFVEIEDESFYKTDAFRIIDHVPTQKNPVSIVKTLVIGNPELKTQSKRFGVLENQIVKRDGTYVKNTPPELIEEYEKLKKILE